MGLNIKNERTVALVRELAALTDRSQTSAIEDAVRARLEQLAGEGKLSAAERDRRARIDRTIGAVQDAARGSGRTREQIDADLYDEAGLPR